MTFRQENAAESIVSFQGRINSFIISEMIEITERSILKYLYNRKSVVIMIRCIVIEILQNLYDHVEKNPDIPPEKKGVEFSVSFFSGSFYVIGGNHITTTETGSLIGRINRVNSLSRDRLKNSYKYGLANMNEPGKTGSGLGLLRTALNSGNKLEYEISNKSEELFYFRMYAKV